MKNFTIPVEMNFVSKMMPVVQSAGDIVLQYFRNPMDVRYKSGGSIYTNVDILVEQYLQQELIKIIPQAGFIAEESAVFDIKDFTWVIDPIDGTRNFVRGLPYFAIGVALMHHHDVVAAIAYAPALQEIFYAQQGYGFWHNGIRIDVRNKAWQQHDILAVVSHAQLQKIAANQHKKSLFLSNTEKVRFRSSGSIVVDLSYIAAGCLDFIWLDQANWWDVAPGILFISQVRDGMVFFRGMKVSKSVHDFVAGDRLLCQDFMQKS